MILTPEPSRSKPIEQKPRPPSVDLMGSWDNLQTAPSTNAKAVTETPVDLLGLSDVNSRGTGWPEPSGTAPQSQWPGSQSATGISVGGKSLLDNDFGEFVTAEHVAYDPSQSSASLVHLAGFDAPKPTAVGVSAIPPVLMTPANPVPLWSNAPNGLKPGNFNLTPSPSVNLFPNGPKTAVTSAPAPKPTTSVTQANAPVQVGSTWKEIDALGINLDTLAQPDNLSQRSAPGPSLRELQAQQKFSSPSSITVDSKSAHSSIFASPLSSPMHAVPKASTTAFQQGPLNPTARPTAQGASQNLVDFSLF
ncbi:unnamed protein product [Echinostoma caproni]|uniref:Epsin-3 n=1 Tax=Echinostoma caproni TaxID=27848 RepID=A0A183AI54_9TREM|nr:unnamed protein product [Echinostoma caproni]